MIKSKKHTAGKRNNAINHAIGMGTSKSKTAIAGDKARTHSSAGHTARIHPSGSLKGYFNMQKAALIDSLKINNPLRAASLMLGKYFSMLVIFTSFSLLILSIFRGIMPLLSSLNELNALGLMANDVVLNQVLQQKSLLDMFLLKTIVLVLATILLLSVIMALFNTLVVCTLESKKWSFSRFLRLTYPYLALTALFSGVLILLFVMINNITALFYSAMISVIIYVYLLFVLQVSMESCERFWKDLSHGFYNCVRLHVALPPLIFALLVLGAILFITGMIALLLGAYSIIILLPALLLWNIWAVNYEYKALRRGSC